MTTEREVKRFLKPLLERRPELVPVGRSVFLPPVRHFVRYIYIDSTSSAEICEPRRIVQALYFPRSFYIVNMSEWIRHPGRGQWKVRNPADAEEFAEISGPFVELIGAVDSPQAFIELEWADHPPHHVGRDYLEFPHRLFAGELDRVRELLQEPHWLTTRQWRPVLERLDLWDSLRENGSSIPQDGKRRLAAWFRDREREVVAALKIGHIWEPTQFPLEIDWD